MIKSKTRYALHKAWLKNLKIAHDKKYFMYCVTDFNVLLK